jgi:phosphomannomutase
MEQSGVGFGTSGVRGLVRDMTDAVCYTYTAGFLQYLERAGQLPGTDRRVAVAGDLRPSTERIMRAAARAVADRGYTVVHCGRIPSPAVANYGFRQRIPTIMVTGSHIPADRNGIKYTVAAGEVLKADEVGVRAQTVDVPDLFDDAGMFRDPGDPLGPVDPAAGDAYIARWRDAFPADFLRGLRLGLYQHSAVGRDLLCDLYSALGADVTPLARSDAFVPVDTEAIRPEDMALGEQWAREYGFHAILSTDGDGDRPLIADETGKWLRGDVAGILCARYLGADTVVVPVSCNTAVERCGWFRAVRRTRIGSPYVIAGMDDAVQAGAAPVVGYEANGGFLTATPVTLEGRTLEPLPTRDPVIVHLALLGLARREGRTLLGLQALLPPRVTASDRIKEMPTEVSKRHLAELEAGGAAAVEALFPELGPVEAIDTTDGLRATFRSGDILHLRPSGNAPELRCYAEAENEPRAEALVRMALERVQVWKTG